MTKITMLSVVAAAVLFVGCGEDSKKAASEATTKAVESTKEAASKAVEATKDAAVATKEAAVEAVDNAEKAVGTAVAGAVDTIIDKAGKEAYAKCAGCHGADGKTLALGKSPVIAGQSKEELVTKLNGYKAGTRNEAGMGNLMKGQVATMDDTAIEAVSIYISEMK
jgi:cytochrome c553